MNKSLYYIECTCIKDCIYRNVEFHIGDILYLNPKVTSHEMFVGYGKEKNPYQYWDHGYLPFTRQKRFAKKWQIKDYVDKYARWINGIGQFNAIVKEIKLTYDEEEV